MEDRLPHLLSANDKRRIALLPLQLKGLDVGNYAIVLIARAAAPCLLLIRAGHLDERRKKIAASIIRLNYENQRDFPQNVENSKR